MVSLNPQNYPLKTSDVIFFLIISITGAFLFIANLPDISYAGKRLYSIQVGAYKDLASAAKKVDELEKLGHNAFYRHERVRGKGNWYRVYIEKYNSKREAKKEAVILKKLNLISAYSIRAVDIKSQTDPNQANHVQKAFFLHVSSFREKANADKKVQGLKDHGHKAFSLSEENLGKAWFRVYIGKFDNEKEARKLGSKLKRRGLISYFKPIIIDKKDLSAKGASTKKIPGP